MIRPRFAIALLLITAAFAILPSAGASPALASGGGCQGDVQVQTDPFHNHYSCDDCAGSIIVQIGYENDVDCGGSSCNGNLFVQGGADNSIDCAAGSLFAITSLSMSPMGPCPRPLPEDNFYCHVASSVLPRQFCLSLDFCLW